MLQRYTDLTSTNDAATDFITRKRAPSLVQLIIIFLFALVVSLFVIVTAMNKTGAIFSLSCALGIIGWYVIVHVQRARDLVLATEFQNALFASALGFNNKFCIIIKREGTIVYMDSAFRAMFPDMAKERHQTVGAMLKHGKVSTIDREHVFAAVERGTLDKVIIDIRSADNRTHKVIITLEPIPRPSGFILLRGREYVEQRSGKNDPVSVAAVANPILNKASMTLFAYIMDRMNTGVYMTDPLGNIIYANPRLERWLSFDEAEILTGTFSLKDIVHQGSSHPGAINPGNFEGEIALQKKEGGLVRAYINQKIVTGSDKKMIGCVAMITNIIEKDPESKKSLW